jgi:FkbM family methyltransferase
MNYKLKSKIARLIPKSIKQMVILEHNEFLNYSLAQEGEDIILNKLLKYKKDGFYIDIGAHHPFRFSNTYIFYKKGWRGINIDAYPGSMIEFKKNRDKDINLELGISSSNQNLKFYCFNEPAYNTFNELEAKSKNEKDGISLVNEIVIKTSPLSDVLDKYLPNSKTQIDFISIDVEGFELEVLNSNNWEKYKPKFLLIEELKKDLTQIINESEVYKFLLGKNYKLVAKTYNTSFYQLND